MKLWITAIAMTIVLSSSVYAESANNGVGKIRFDLDQLDESGLYGPENGKRSLAYEFCIPYIMEEIEAVQDIDPTVIVYLHSPGRVGCDDVEVLAIGHTHQPNYRDVLRSLADLDSVERIEQFLAE